MYFLYNFCLILLWPLAALYMLWRHYGLKKSAAPWWGRVPPTVAAALNGKSPRFWLHGVSVGEVMAAKPVARALKSTFPHCAIAISTTTETGQNAANQGMANGEFDAVFYYPVDFPWAVRRALDSVQPDAVLLMETELWPNFLHIARQKNIPVFQINGRVSDNMLRQSKRWHPLWNWMMRNITAIFVRSDFDAQRLRELGAAPSKVRLTGDVKLDGIDVSISPQNERERIRQLLQIDGQSPFWIGGSTHEGEEEILLQVQRALIQSSQFQQSPRLLLAPRHPERVEQVLALAQQNGFAAVRRSALSSQTTRPDAVIILDTVGELAGFYAAADAAFVGGSLIERGGHNILEPVLAGIPVLFGPHMQNFRAACQLVQDAGAGKCIHSADELQAALQDWLTNPTLREEMMQGARKTLSQHQGAAQRVAEGIKEYLDKA